MPSVYISRPDPHLVHVGVATRLRNPSSDRVTHPDNVLGAGKVLDVAPGIRRVSEVRIVHSPVVDAVHAAAHEL